MTKDRHGFDCDVAIVGAGPTGMTAAVLLAARGIRVSVFERRTTTSDEPKAISLDDEALRVYQQAGIVDDLMAVIVPGIGTRYFDRKGEELFQARAAVPYRFGYPFKNPFAQPDLERVLAQSLQAHSLITLHFDSEVVGLTQGETGVSLSVKRGQDAVTVTSRYALAADGGRSTVRTLLGVAMTGRRYDTPWLVADTLGDPHTERYGMHFGDPRRPHVIVPGLHGRCRYEFLLHPGEAEAGKPPSFELIKKLVAPYREIEPDQVERAVNYTFNGLNATTWRVKRTFLLGDAAHMMPPFAGQGLNSGIRDANNIAWKLAEVVSGAADDDILDSYEAERQPHAAATIRASEKLGRVVMTTSPRLAEHRDRAVRRALDTADGRAFFEEMRYRPVARIDTGLVHRGSRPELVGSVIGQPRVFDSASHQVVMLDRILGSGWAVIGVGVSADQWREGKRIADCTAATTVHAPLDDKWPRGMPVDRVMIDVDGGLGRELAPYSGKFLLIRPDKIIAAVWDTSETDTVCAVVSRWSTRPGSN